MRITVVAKVLFGLLIAMSIASVRAEENRYKAWIEDNVLYRFDNQTAEIHKLVKPSTGAAVWVKCDVVEPKAPQSKTAKLQEIPASKYQPDLPPPRHPKANSIPPEETASRVPPNEHTQAVAVLDSGDEPVAKKASGRRIELFNDLGVNITDEIEDSMRDDARARINGYDKLSVSHTLKTNGDRISGIIILDNKGDKRIALLELTMYVPVHGTAGPKVAQRFIFSASKPDGERPPAPSNGMSGLSVMKKIDVATPSGVISGMPDVRVTFLSFQE